MDAIATCQICLEDFDGDPSIADKSSSHLPVQSARCPHRACYSCVVVGMKMEKANKLNKDPIDIKWLECPMCREKTCFNTRGPVVDLSLCEALRILRATNGNAVGQRATQAETQAMEEGEAEGAKDTGNGALSAPAEMNDDQKQGSSGLAGPKHSAIPAAQSN